MEFPRHCHKPEGRYVVVTTLEQYDAVMANGWTDRPAEHVEKPVEVRYAEAISGSASTEPEGNVSPSVSDLNVKDAAILIASADADALAMIEADENAGKGRAGVLKAIDARKAELSA